MNPLTALPTFILTHVLIQTIENITFTFGNFTLKILILSSFGLLWILFWNFLVNQDTDSKINIPSKWYKFSKENGLGFIQKSHLSTNKLYKILLIIVLVFLSVIFYFTIFLHYSIDDKQHLVFLIINFQLIPGMYIFLENKLELIFITYLITISLFGIFMIDNVKSNHDKSISLNKNNINSVIRFDYKTINSETSQNSLLFIHGYEDMFSKAKNRRTRI